MSIGLFLFAFSSAFSFIVLGTLVSIFTLSNILRLYLSTNHSITASNTQYELSLTQLIEQHPLDYRWALKFIINCCGYSCIFVPGILIYQYTKKVKYLERCGKLNSNIFSDAENSNIQHGCIVNERNGKKRNGD